MQLSADPYSLSQLLDGGTRIRIPEYQRNYAWTGENIDQYIDDLAETISSAEEHFFGPIVLLEEGKDTFSVIDGQQRLTTTIMLLCLIRDRLASMDNPVHEIGGVQIHLRQDVNTMLKHKNFVDYRFTANRQIATVFESYIMQEPGPLRKQLTRTGKGLDEKEKENTKALRSAYFRLAEGLSRMLDEHNESEEALAAYLYSVIDTLRNSMKVLKITVPDESDAYALFETLNDRGVRLSASDLLKSYTLRGAKDLSEIDIEDVVSKWDEANELLGNFSFEKFLRHYLLATQDAQKVQTKSIFPMFRRRIDEIGPLTNLDQIAGATYLYAQLINESVETGDAELDATLVRINLISITHRVFLLSVFEGISDEGGNEGWSSQLLRYAARATEMLAFRWTLRGKNAQQLEGIYQHYANRVRREATPGRNSGALKDILEELMDEAPSDDEIRIEITSSGVKQDHLSYVLNRLEGAQSGDLLRWVRQKPPVQTLAPQTPSVDSNWYQVVAPPKASADGAEKAYEEYVQMWGNYTLTEFPLENAIKHTNWRKKIEGALEVKGLNKSDVQMNKDLSLIDQLTKDHIVARTEWMADAMVLLSSAKAAGNAQPAAIEGFRL